MTSSPAPSVDVHTWCTRAATARQRGAFDEARDAADHAVALDPESVDARIQLAHAALAQRDVAMALRACQHAMRREPHNPFAHHAAACALVDAGEFEMAERHYRIALELDPGAPPLLAEYADLLRRLDRLDDALEVYEMALARDPELVDAHTGLLQLLDARGDRAGVEARARRLLERFPHDPVALSAASDRLIARGHGDDAVPILERAVENRGLKDEQRAALLFLLGSAHDRAGRVDAAWSAYAAANDCAGVAHDPRAADAFVDAILAQCTTAFLDTAPRAASADPRPLFIVGMPRSGTTLLERVLDAHPAITGAGEAEWLRRAVGRIATRTNGAGAFPGCLASLDRAGVDALASFLLDARRAVAAGAPIVVDKTPDALLFLGVAELVCPNAVIVWMRRDPLDTCLSCYQQYFRGAIDYAYDLTALGAAYRRHERVMTAWQARLRLPIVEVTYEALVDDPQAAVTPVLDALGLAWDDAMLDFHAKGPRVHTASLDQVRQPLYRTSVRRAARYDAWLQPLKDALRA